MPERRHFQQQLAELERHALGGLDLVLEQLDRVLESIEHQDVELAQLVILDDDRLDGRYLEVHQGILSLLALQSPVAGDLRLVRLNFREAELLWASSFEQLWPAST